MRAEQRRSDVHGLTGQGEMFGFHSKEEGGTSTRIWAED